MSGYRARASVPIRSRNITPGGNSGGNKDIGGAGDTGRKNRAEINSKKNFGNSGGNKDAGGAGDTGRKNGAEINSKKNFRGGDGADSQNRRSDYRSLDAERGRARARVFRNMGTRGTAGDEVRRGQCLLCSEYGHASENCPSPNISEQLPYEKTDKELWEKHVHGVDFDHYYGTPVQVVNDDGDDSHIQNFEDANLAPAILHNVQRAGYKRPTPIQQHAIPWILKGKDLMASAQTGSGKTAAFMLPILSAFVQSRRISENGIPAPFALVIEPTHELALQVQEEARKFASGTATKVVVAYGKTNPEEHIFIRDQLEMLRNGCDILVATPGRLMFLVKHGHVKLAQCKFLVLDEADRLLEKDLCDLNFDEALYNSSFWSQMNKLVGRMPPKTVRQTLMFSAAYPKAVQELANEYLNNYVRIHVGEVGAANKDIVQELLRVKEAEKMETLIALTKKDLLDFQQDDGTCSALTLVFVNRTKTAKHIAERLCHNDVPAAHIHADLDQIEREKALNGFKTCEVPVLVATSVAARGLDIERVQHVINYDMPLTIEDYVFRIGRTGRIGKRGLATSFFGRRRHKGHFAIQLLKVLRNAEQVVPNWFLKKYGGVEKSFAGEE